MKLLIDQTRSGSHTVNFYMLVKHEEQATKSTNVAFLQRTDSQGL